MCERCDARPMEPRGPCGYRRCQHPEAAHGFRRIEWMGQGDGRPHWMMASGKCEELGCSCQGYRVELDPASPPCLRCGEDFYRHGDRRRKVCPDCRGEKGQVPDTVDEMRREHRRHRRPFDTAA